MSPWIPTALQLAGSVVEIAGVLLMANGVLAGVAWGGVFKALLDGLRRGPGARGAVRMSELTDEDRVVTLQGLAFILVGFMLQGLGTLATLVIR